MNAGGEHKYHWQETTSELDICRKATNLSKTGKPYCAALLGDKYRAMAPFYKFAADGSMSSYASRYARSGLTTVSYSQSGKVWQNLGRELVGEGGDGDVFAVVPGSYIVEISDAAGKLLSQTRVEAN